MAGKRKKVRVSFRKNRAGRSREQNLTHRSLDDLDRSADQVRGERISGKGDVSRRRTVITETEDDSHSPRRVIDESVCVAGRVLRAIGANRCVVQAAGGEQVECTVRRVVRTLAREARNVVVAGDEVLFQPTGGGAGVIERVEPRRSVISRGSARFEHVIVANVDRAVIVVSADDPPLKPALIDRFLVSAAKGNVRAIVCINKVDLVDRVLLQPLAGVYARLGYDVVLTSVRTGAGIDRLRDLLRDQESVVAGQSGVGKSSLITAVDSALTRAVGEVSHETGKGKHTTRVAELLPLSFGGWVVDTPGIRQMQLWDVALGEVEGYFLEFAPFVARCRFPDCTHTHEEDCAVKDAVSDGLIARTRYEGYIRILLGDE